MKKKTKVVFHSHIQNNGNVFITIVVTYKKPGFFNASETYEVVKRYTAKNDSYFALDKTNPFSSKAEKFDNFIEAVEALNAATKWLEDGFQRDYDNTVKTVISNQIFP